MSAAEQSLVKAVRELRAENTKLKKAILLIVKSISDPHILRGEIVSLARRVEEMLS